LDFKAWFVGICIAQLDNAARRYREIVVQEYRESIALD
jgi:hypothetical protein